MTIILFIIILLALVLVHEFGHFITAKKSGIRVDEFGVGFPPRLFGKKFGETIYSLNWFPIGGFVKIFGENPDDDSINGPDKERSFVHQSKRVQALVLSAGILFNILFAWLLFSIIFMVGMPSLVDEEDVNASYVEDVSLTITAVLPDSPAHIAGLKAGDRLDGLQVGEKVGTVDGVELTTNIVSNFIEEHGREGSNVTVMYSRGDTKGEVVIKPIENLIPSEPERHAIGIAMGFVGTVKHNPFVAVFEGLKHTINATIMIGVGIVTFFASVFTFSADLSGVAGPIGIVSLVGDTSALGLIFLLNFTAFLSINLAIINLLPVPALDGGRLLFLLIEVIKGSPIKPSIANLVNALGFGFLIILMMVITYSDIARIISG